MKLTLKELDAQLALAATLAGDAQAKMHDMLKSATVFEVDEKGVETVHVVKIDPIAKALPAPKADPVVDVDALVKAAVAAEMVKQRKPPITAIDIPATVMGGRKSRHFKTNEDAYVSGMWFLATLGSKKAVDFCTDRGIQLQKGFEKVHSTVNNSAGGFLVIPQFENAIIDLRERFGVFRQFSDVMQMTSDTLTIPRRAGGLTAFFPSENSAITESADGSWDQVNLTAKKAAVLTRISAEINEDSIINIADDLAGLIARAFSRLEDDCGFNGDGTGPFARIVGVRNALTNLSGTVANIAGLQVATGTGYAASWNSITLADFNNVLGRLPLYAQEAGDVAWYCSQAFWGSVMQRLALAAGGNAQVDVVNGVTVPSFLGYPVRVAQVLPSASAISQVPVLFGNLRMASKFGDRRGTTISVSDSAVVNGESTFERDQLAVRGTERFDIVVHDVGNQSATAASRQAGPIVGLITATS